LGSHLVNGKNPNPTLPKLAKSSNFQAPIRWVTAYCGSMIEVSPKFGDWSMVFILP